jgi:hypothetical protein
VVNQYSVDFKLKIVKMILNVEIDIGNVLKIKVLHIIEK